MFHVNTYVSVTKVSIIKEDLMMMMMMMMMMKLEISRAPTKAKSRELSYLQALIQSKIDRQRIRSRESGRQTVRRLWWMGHHRGRLLGEFTGGDKSPVSLRG